MFYSSINNHVKRDNITIVLKCNLLRVVRSVKFFLRSSQINSISREPDTD